MASAQPAGNVTNIDDARPKSKKTLVIAIAAVLLLGGGGGAAWFLMKPAPDAAHAATKPEPPAPPVFVELEAFTVNLGGDRILQTTVSLQVKKAEDAELLKTWMPQVKSRMLMLLSSQSAEELQTPAGKEALTANIGTQLKKPYAKGVEAPHIDGVFLTSFVIQ